MEYPTINKKLKILYITRGAFGLIGGAAAYKIPEYMSKNHDVLVLETKKKGCSAEVDQVVFQSKNSRLINIYGEKEHKRTQKLKRVLKKFNPDIVHVFQSPRCLRDIYCIRMLSSKFALILDFRTPLYAKRFSWLHANKIFKFFLSQFFIDWIITHSKQTLSSNLPACFKKTTEISPGVDLKQFSNSSRHKPYPKRFVFIGTLAKSRKIKLLIDYFIHMIQKGRPQIALDIYGQGDAVDEIDALITKTSMQESISLKGLVSQRELFNRLNGYDAGIAYVPDSDDWGNFSKAPSLKSLEYSAAGLPIVASSTMGHSDYIKRYGFEFVLFDNTKDSFTQTMEKVCDKGFSPTMVQNNLNVIKEFDWNSIISSKLLPLYSKLSKSKIK